MHNTKHLVLDVAMSHQQIEMQQSRQWVKGVRDPSDPSEL